MLSNDEYIVQILQDVGLLSRAQIESAQTLSEHGNVLDYLVEQGIITQEDITRTLAAQSSMEFYELNQRPIEPEIIATIPAEMARRYKVIPVAKNDQSLIVATSNPLDFETFDSLSFLLKREVEFVCSTVDSINKALIQYYGTVDDATALLMDQLGGDIDLGEEAVGPLAEGDGGDAPIIKMVTMLILEAYKNRASDIHLEPMEKQFRVRFRVDGMLQEMHSPPKKLQSAIVSRLKSCPAP